MKISILSDRVKWKFNKYEQSLDQFQRHENLTREQMPESKQRQIRHIHGRWHEKLVDR